MRKQLFMIFLIMGFACSFIQAQSPMPKVSEPVYFDVSPPLTQMVPTTTPPEKDFELNKDAEKREYPFWEPMGPDPVWQKQMGTNNVTDGITRNFAGIDCPSGLSPSDDNGDIGPTHYIQTVNSQFQVFNRNGSSAYGPVNINTLFSSLPGGSCNSGDPIVLYDEQADRWLIAQFSLCTATKYMHIAVSTSSSALGTYYRWAYSWGTAVPDYPKIGVWRDSYLMGLNNGSVDDIVAFDRSEMLAGLSASMVSFDNPWRPASGLHCVQPLDNDGAFAPVGSPGLFITINDNAWGGSDQLWVYALTVDWTNPAGATFNRIHQLATAAFDSNFGGTWQNIPQPGTANKLELLSQVLMFRAQYRNFGSYQSIVCCHDVDVNGADHAGIRWYELRKTGANWAIYQQGTYAPDAHHRWMGSISQNGDGDIALGYSVASSTVYPSIRYTGRKASDPLGTMGYAEQTIWNGTQSQTDGERWGDYSSMSVDPNDDKTFWYTTQYAGGSAWNWHTRIASFKFDLYCTASGGCDEFISRVQLGTIDNSSACDGYRDYTDISTDFPLNAVKTLTVTNGVTSYPSDQCGVWVDWNRDNDFADANEAITVTGTPGIGPYTAAIDPPAGTTTGPVRMRVRITYTGAVDPCGATTYGEVEDYTINLTPNATNTWIGVTSIDWQTASNWSLGAVPDDASDVTIPSGTPFQPTIPGGTPYAYAKTVTIQSGAVLTQATSSYFYVYGNFNSDAGQFTMVGTSYLYFAGAVNNSWDDDNENDTYTNVRVLKDGVSYQTTMWQNMTCSGTFEVREGTFAIDATWTLTITSTGTSAFEVEDGGKLTLNDESIVCSGNVHFMDGSQAEINGGVIDCKRDFVVDANVAYNIAFAGGILRMSGTVTQYIDDLDGGTLDLWTLIINKTGTCYIKSANLDLNNQLNIAGGVLSCNNGPSPTATYNINIAGHWYNQLGPAAFEESTGTVIFDGASGHQYSYTDNFNVLEVNKASGALRVDGHTVTCNSYNWTAGAVDVLSGTFTANDLADNGLFGAYYVNPGGTMNLHQDLSQYVDLNCGMYFTGGGTINVYGGNGYSYWPYAANATITMSGGVLDFVDNGIYIYNTGTYSLTDNITAGTIRMSQGFSGNRADFTPTAGIFEFYGPSDYTISQTNGCTLFDVVINKSAKDGEAKGPQVAFIDERSGQVLTDGGKANTITLASNFTITGDLDINAGTFDLASFTCTVTGTTNVNAATLAMTQATNDLTTGVINWNAGSNDNVTAGTFHAHEWGFWEGTNAMIGTGNTAYVYNLWYPTDTDAEHGNLVAVAADEGSGLLGKAFYPVRVAGNFTIQTGVLWTFSNPATDVIVAGNSVIQNGGNLSFISGADFITSGTLDLSGRLNVGSGSVATIHGNISFPSTGWLSLNVGSFVCDYNNSSGLTALSGRLTMNDGSLLEFPQRSINIGTTFVNEITGGIMRFGRTLNATTAGTFQITGAVTEFVTGNSGHYVNLTNGNYLNSMVVNKPAGTLQVYSDLMVKDDVTISAGNLNSSGNIMYVGGDWTNNVGTAGFTESTGKVVFDGALEADVLTSETFYNVDMNKTYAGYLGLEFADGITVNVTGNLNVLDGTIEMNANSILNLTGNLAITLNAGLNSNDGGNQINIGGNWTNNNTGYNTIYGYTPGGTVTFNGSALQTLNTAAAIEDFDIVVINKPTGDFRPNDNMRMLGNFNVQTGTFLDQVAGLTHYVLGDMTIGATASYYSDGTTVFKGTTDQYYTANGGGLGRFEIVTIDKTVVDKGMDNIPSGGEPVSSIAMGGDPKALTVFLNSNMVCFNGGGLTIDEGTLDLNHHILKVTGAININDGGILQVDDGANLECETSLNVNNLGTLQTYGTAGSNALVSRDAIGYYDFNVNSGGTISSRYTIFEDMTGNGIYIKSGALVDAANSFTSCTFRNGAAAPSALMSIHNSQDFTVNNAVFPANTWGGGYNVWKNVNTGHVLFNGASGAFAGPAFEYDPYNRIDWNMLTPGLWTGAVSTNWFATGNWSDGTVPIATTNVTIPAGCPNYPVLNAAGAVCDDFTMEAGSSMTLGTYLITCNGAISINGTLNVGASGQMLGHTSFTTGSSGIINISGGSIVMDAAYYAADAWQYFNGTLNMSSGLIEMSHNSFNFTATAVNTISGGTLRCGFTFYAPFNNFMPTGGLVEFIGSDPNCYISLEPFNNFYDLTINKGVAIELASDIRVRRNINLISGPLNTYDIAMIQHDITVGGNWTNTGGEAVFNEGTGRVIFNGNGPTQNVSAENFYNVTQDYNAPGSYLQFTGALNIAGYLELGYFTWINNTANIAVLNLSNTSSKFTANNSGNGTIGMLYQGGTMVGNGGIINVLDLNENGVFGTYTMNNGTVTLNQDIAQFPDLNATVNIINGTLSIVGGNGSSWWSYAGNCSVTMSGGIFNFQNNGINIYQSGTYTLTENITGGTIRTNGSLTVGNAGFIPAGNTFEFYGISDANFAMSAGSVNNVVVNKSAEDGSIPELFYDREGKIVDGGKANTVFLASDVSIPGTLVVDEGTLHLNGFIANCYNNVTVNSGGILFVSDNADLLVENAMTVTVNNGGNLRVIGSSGNLARVARISAGNYNLNIESGGTISARYGMFEHMGNNGIYIKAGAVVDPSYTFDYCTFQNGKSGYRLMVINNAQTFNVNYAVFPNNTWGGLYNVYKSVNTGVVNFMFASGGFAGQAFEYDPNNRINWISGTTLDLTVMLEGPFNGAGMNTTLNPANLPLSQPYGPGLPYFGNPMPEWYYTGAEAVGAIPNPSVVDWVYLELRDAASAAAATKATMIANGSFFLLSNGKVVALDGVSNPSFPATASTGLYVAIWHRNHLGVLSATALTMSGGVYTYNFTTAATQAYGGATGHKQIGPGIWGMVSGDGNGDGVVANTDKNNVWKIQTGSSGYKAADFNLNGQVDNIDKTNKWKPNSGAGSQVPDSMTPPGGYKSLIP